MYSGGVKSAYLRTHPGLAVNLKSLRGGRSAASLTASLLYKSSLAGRDSFLCLLLHFVLWRIA